TGQHWPGGISVCSPGRQSGLAHSTNLQGSRGGGGGGGGCFARATAPTISMLTTMAARNKSAFLAFMYPSFFHLRRPSRRLGQAPPVVGNGSCKVIFSWIDTGELCGRFAIGPGGRRVSGCDGKGGRE